MGLEECLFLCEGLESVFCVNYIVIVGCPPNPWQISGKRYRHIARCYVVTYVDLLASSHVAYRLVCLSVSLSLYLSISLSVSRSLYVLVSISVCLSSSLCLCLCLSSAGIQVSKHTQNYQTRTHLIVSILTCPRIVLSVRPSVRPSGCLSVCLSVCLLFICKSISASL